MINSRVYSLESAVGVVDSSLISKLGSYREYYSRYLYYKLLGARTTARDGAQTMFEYAWSKSLPTGRPAVLYIYDKGSKTTYQGKGYHLSFF